jgi:hypothetical protein
MNERPPIDDEEAKKLIHEAAEKAKKDMENDPAYVWAKEHVHTPTTSGDKIICSECGRIIG